jgi:hypothetical protein
MEELNTENRGFSAPLRHGFFEEMFENQLFIHISARLQGTSTKLRL